MLFDLNGTLLDPMSMELELGSAVAPEELLSDAFGDAVLQAMADTLSGVYRAFDIYVQAALARRLRLAGESPALAADVAKAMRRMPAYADSLEAVSRLENAGFKVGVLTNSQGPMARDALAGAGLLGSLQAIISSDQVGRYKPALELYEFASRRLGVAPGRIWLVAAHWWDVTGAKRAGMRTAWIARKERELIWTSSPPEVVAADLKGAAEEILRLKLVYSGS